MRYSAIIKFFAVILCAAVIVTAIGSGAGLLALTESGLYSRTLDEFYTEEMELKAQVFGHSIAARYASLSLGGASQSLANDCYGLDYAFFLPDRVGYTLTDAEGTVLQTDALPSAYTVQKTISVPVEGEYIKVLSEAPVTEADQSPAQPEDWFGDVQVSVCPTGTQEVTYVLADYADGVQEDYVLPNSGFLEVDENGSILFRTTDMPYMLFMDPRNEENGTTLTHMLFSNAEGVVVYEASGTGNLVQIQEYHRDGITRIQLPGTDQQQLQAGVTMIHGDFSAYDAIPQDGAVVFGTQISYGTLEEGTTAGDGITSTQPLGHLYRNPDGNVWFQARDPGSFDIPMDALITGITFLDQSQNRIYEANSPSGVGRISYDQDGRFYFYGENPGLKAPEETVPETTAPAEDATIRGVVLKDTDVYSMPSRNGRKVATLTAGSEVTVLQQEHLGEDRWGLVDSGWVHLKDIVLEQTMAEAAPAAEEVVIHHNVQEPIQATVAEDADTYSMPTLAASPSGALTKGQTVTLLSQDSYGGIQWGLTEAGWVPMQYLIPEAPQAPAETEPEETMPTEPAVEETVSPAPTAPQETEPEALAKAASVLTGYEDRDIHTYRYYNHELQQRMEVQYVMEPLPEYTLELQLAPGADRTELLWLLLGIAYYLRSFLLQILGLSLAMFGLCVVYLCCAAAHKRGSTAIRAGGLNRLPLDGYLLLAGCLVTGMVLLGYEGSEYFIRKGLSMYALSLLGGSAYLCSLLLVGFCFAFVSQIKTPGGYWWRSSLCGRCLLLAVSLCRKTVVFFTSRGWQIISRLVRWIRRMAVALFLFGGRAALWLWDTAKRLGLWLWDLTGRCLKWTRSRLARFFGMLPITWQFLTTGFFLVFMLYVAIRTYKVGYLLLGFGIFFAVILYAATAFGILLESARRMSKGDLDTQVDDRMLIGGFRDFAQRLNDLAGVAVIAAQKQLKSERMKTELITNVSHDIKTPLTSIINYVDLLRKPHTEQQQEQYLEVLDRQSQRLKKLIDDLMEMSKASTGNLTVDIVTVDAAEAVNQALGEFADKLDRAQLVPVFRQPDDPVYMLADGRLVWRVMSNLLGNAVKYALPGTRLYLDLLEMDGKVIISLKNISREELNVNADELMERFVRGDTSRNTEGSGLGLNIAQSLMELQRGQLQILVDGDLFKVTLIFPAA